MSSKVEISLSKTKITGLFVGSIMIVILGILFISIPEAFVSPIVRSPEVIRISGVLSAVFFGICLVFITHKLFDNKPGLIIDQYGITNNTNAMGIGLIEWDDITGIEKKQVVSTHF